MKMNHLFIFISLLFGIISCGQAEINNTCDKKIDELYEKHKIHLIYCSYYFDKVNMFSGADSVYNDLTYYRDSSDKKDITRKDHQIVENLKRNVCQTDTSLIAQMNSWCTVSKQIGNLRSVKNFTLEGYMEFLEANEGTKKSVTPFLKGDRTIYSLSTYEMEMVYFRSIGIISSLSQKTQQSVFKKLESWKFS